MLLRINYISVLKILVISLLFCEYTNSGSDSTHTNPKIILVKVADREITLDDFIRRSEYTIRPPYCRGNTNIDKKIILNSLIAEKILSLESGVDNKFIQNEKFSNYITGLTEQKMRELLSYYEGDTKVKLDTNEINKIFTIAGRTYRIEYFNVPDLKLAKKFSAVDSSFMQIYKTSGITDSIYQREVSWSAPETKIIHEALFSEKLIKNQMIGPLNINDSTNLFIKINGWNDRVVLTERDISQRWNDVSEKLSSDKANEIYEKFVLNVMGNKTITFNADVFSKVAKLLAPFYLNIKEKTAEEFLSLAYDKNLETPDMYTLGNSYNAIKEEPLFSIEGRAWSIEDFKREMDKHPLVFRKDDKSKNFTTRLKNAIVDLVRDKYLTDVAYKRGYNNNEVVVRYEQSWLDASVAFFQKQEYLKNFDVSNKKEIEVIEKYLNPYVEELLKKYSDKIEINVEEFNRIKLTRIDMFVTQEQVPYPVYVPAFPHLTNYNRLDYGKKMNVN